MPTRADRNRNPAAITTDVAKDGGLVEGVDYQTGDPFTVGTRTYWTAHLLGDPVALTIRVIDTAGYYTTHGSERWTYIAMPKFVWDSLTPELKKRVIAFHYQHEGGTDLAPLFA